MKQHISSPKFTRQETQLIQQLRQQPQMLARVQSILDLAHAADGPLKTADAVAFNAVAVVRAAALPAGVPPEPPAQN